jgi:F-type H+-transporting ATPase subunit b
MELSKLFYVKRICKIIVLSILVMLLVAWISSVSVSAQHGEAGKTPEGEQTTEHQGGSPWSTVFKWANFLILFGGLGWMLRAPMMNFLESRRQEITEGLTKAAEARADADRKLAEVETRLTGLDQEIRQLKEQALQQAEEERLHILEMARQEAQKIMEMASMEIEGMRKAARQELKTHVAELAVRLAEERLKSAIGPVEHKKIVERFVEDLGVVKN